MGVILDSTALIRAERQGQSVRQILTNISRILDEDESPDVIVNDYDLIGVSVITLMELAHGAFRADTTERRHQRSAFVDQLVNALPVYPITESIAGRAAAIDAQTRAKEIRLHSLTC